MALKDTEMHVMSVFGAIGLSAALLVPTFYFTDPPVIEAAPLREQQVIEATIAYKKVEQKQPQKNTAPPPVEKPEGVSRDENKKPVEKPKDEKPKPQAKPDDTNPFGKFARPGDEGPATTPTIGDFNGDERGFAPESRGDPFFGRLRRDMNFEFPKIAKAGGTIPIGCIHLQADGRIKATSFDPPIGTKGDDDVQIAAEAAFAELKKIRARDPEPVPTHLLSITSKWLCFKFSVSSG
jgi:hypothetical protein